jgi:hypothetical protein
VLALVFSADAVALDGAARRTSMRNKPEQTFLRRCAAGKAVDTPSTFRRVVLAVERALKHCRLGDPVRATGTAGTIPINEMLDKEYLLPDELGTVLQAQNPWIGEVFGGAWRSFEHQNRSGNDNMMHLAELWDIRSDLRVGQCVQEVQRLRSNWEICINRKPSSYRDRVTLTISPIICNEFPRFVPTVNRSLQRISREWDAARRKLDILSRLTVRGQCLFKAVIQDCVTSGQERHAAQFTLRYPDPDPGSLEEDLISRLKNRAQAVAAVADSGLASDHLGRTLSKVAKTKECMISMFILLVSVSSAIAEKGSFPCIEDDSDEPYFLPACNLADLLQRRISAADLKNLGQFLLEQNSSLPLCEQTYRDIITAGNMLEHTRSNVRPGVGGIEFSTFVEIWINAVYNGRLLLPLPESEWETARNRRRQKGQDQAAAEDADAQLYEQFRGLGALTEKESRDQAYLLSGIDSNGSPVQLVVGKGSGAALAGGDKDSSLADAHPDRMDTNDVDDQVIMPPGGSRQRGDHRSSRVITFQPLGIENICSQDARQAKTLNACFFISILQVCAIK